MGTQLNLLPREKERKLKEKGKKKKKKKKKRGMRGNTYGGDTIILLHKRGERDVEIIR